MIALVLETYRIIFYLTGARRFAYLVSVAYIALLNFFVFGGIATLLEDVFSPMKMITRGFHGILSYPTFVVLFFLNYLLVPIKMTDVAFSFKTKYAKLIIYTVLALTIFAYYKFLDRYFH